MYSSAYTGTFTVVAICNKSSENTPLAGVKGLNGLARAAKLALRQIYVLVIIISLLLLPRKTFLCLKKDMLIQL